MGVRSHDPWRRALGSGLVLFGVALLLSVVIGPRIAPAATGAAEFSIVTTSDDAEQLVSGWLGLASSDLELVDEISPQVVGLRFDGVSIPPGASITSAHIQFTVDEVSLGTADLQVAAHDVGNAPTFSSSDPVIGRPVTASVSWSPPPWPAIGASGVEQETIDLSTLIQAIVDRPDWATGNAIAFVVTGTGTRTASSFESGHPPVLAVTWSTEPTSTTTTTPPTTTTTTTTAPSTTTTTTSSPTTTTTVTTTTTTIAPTTTTMTTTVPPSDTASIDLRVGAATDDAEELPSGYLYSNSSDLELVEDSQTQTVGIRFVGVDVPAGSAITRAWLQFTVDERSPGTSALTIAAHDTANPEPFIGNLDLSRRALTTARVSWAPPEWLTVGATTADQRTPDLRGILQEIVDRPDWTAGSAVAFVITGTGRRTAESFDGSRSTAPLLHIEWTTTVPNPTTTTTTTTTTVPTTTTTTVPTTTTTTTSPPANLPPSVDPTGSSTWSGEHSVLVAHVTDDGLPNPPGATTVVWEQVDGPAPASIEAPDRHETRALLPTAGTYVFRVTADDGLLRDQGTVTVTATDPTPSSGTTRLAVIGDYGGSRTRMLSLAAMVDSLNPDAVVTVGDNLYSSDGYDRLVGRYFQQYIGDYTGAYGAGSTVNRFFPALGNHDYEDGGIANYEAFFDLPGTGVTSTGSSGNERYYDARIGNVHLFVVNSNPEGTDGLTPTTSQGQWLRSALQSSDAEWKIVVNHHPPYSSLPGKTAQWMRWPFRAWGADLVLSGDAHAYERLESDGLTYVINGLGINNSILDGPRIPESRVFWSQNTPASLLIEACPGSLQVELHPVGYAMADRFAIGTGICP